MNLIEASLFEKSTPRIRPPTSNRSIGAILVDAGRLTTDGAERILHLQKKQDMRFGDAAIKLGLLDDDDIRFALSSQFEYPYLPADDESLSPTLVAAYAPFSPAVEQLRALRSQLMLRCFDGDARSSALAIVSPEAGEGRSFIAANLAIVFSQLGERTLLIDANLRAPRQHELFKLGHGAGLSDLLAGRANSWGAQRVRAMRGLSILPAGAVPPNPQELLGRPAFASALQSFANDYDVILIDTPAAADFADAQTIAARAGTALIVARSGRSAMAGIGDLMRGFQQSGTTIVGSVLNDAATRR